MTPYHAQHAGLFRAVAEILVRDYTAPSETAETVAEWCKLYPRSLRGSVLWPTTLMAPSALAALIADVEGYKHVR